MINDTNQRVLHWIRDIVGKTEVSGEWPSSVANGARVHVSLWQLTNELSSPGLSGKPAALRLVLRYIVTATAPKIDDVHRLLDELVSSATEHAEYRAVFQEIPLDLWLAIGSKPHPAFVLEIPVVVEHLRKPPKRVQKIDLHYVQSVQRLSEPADKTFTIPY